MSALGEIRTTAHQLAASLRKMAAEFPATDEEQRTLKGAAELLEKIEGFAQHLKDEALEYREDLKHTNGRAQLGVNRSILAAKASVYHEESRQLAAILEGRQC